MQIRKGDIVGRKSYGKDILFKVNNIVKKTDEDVAILNGITKRIEADSKISDLEIISIFILFMQHKICHFLCVQESSR